jgi:hypothetical protein
MRPLTSKEPMRSRAVWSIVCLLLAASPAVAGEDWEVTRKEDRLTVYNRTKAGSDLKEVKAVGTILAPPWVVKNVLDDVPNYKHFMPYTEESKLIKRGSGFMVSYQRLNAPIIANRDYTIRIQDESRRLPDGRVVYKRAWSPANHLGPPERSGTVRVKINQGYWLLEDANGGKHTKATYWLFTNPGGSLPTFVINAANGQAIPGIFQAVEKRSAMPQYQKTKPKLPSDTDVAPPPKLVSPKD